MASSGFPGYDPRGGYVFRSGSTVQIPFQTRLGGGGGGGVLKRSMTEMERQMALQQAIFLRSVRQKTSPVSPLSSSMDFSSTTTVTTTSSSPLSAFSSGSGFARLAPEPDSVNRSTVMQNQLQELERRLLDDDDEEDESAVTTTEWGETMQQLISISPLSPSPSNSSSSTASSTASCSPSSSTPSRQLLSDAAAGIAEGNLEAAAATLTVLKRTGSNPRGDPEQRLTAIMITALASRLSPPLLLGINPISDLCSLEHRAATQMLHDHSPCFKLGLYTANLAILDSTAGGDQIKIHLIDFDVGGGSQHASLIHALAERYPSRPSALKITAVSDPTSPFSPAAAASLRSVGDRLVNLAERAGVGLRFSIVNRRIADLDPTSLGCEPGEALAVNLAFVLSKVADESVSPANPRDELLRRVRSLSPKVVTLVEQEMNANTAPFAARFREACGHYGALLESLDSTMNRDSPDRARLEAGLVRKATNSIAREGPNRVERCEVFGKWRARFGMAGFKPVPLNSAVLDPVRARLASIKPNHGFTIKEEAGGIGFGWMGRVLTFASAWR
ncbi:scarecrow-like protein 8 [Typha latifolia]|uniref:scarecrow-like protein 8 n=1 Tax=Typha latifolia TaxID=4733 RepID=UPI003C2DE3AC